MASSRLLTKSRYCEYMTCPKKAWMSASKPSERVIDTTTQMRFDIGRNVGMVARGLFPNGQDAYIEGTDGRPDISAMLAETEKLMADPAVDVIYEAAFAANGCYCAVDILVREPSGGWTVHEVKSSTKEKDGHRREVAFQHYVASLAGVEIAGDKLVLIDSSYVRGDELEVDKLFKTVDVTGRLSSDLAEVEDNVEMAKTAMLATTEPPSVPSMGCHSPYDCPYWNYCSSKCLPENSVFDLYKVYWTKKVKLYSEGQVSFADVDGADWLTDIQQRQISHALIDMSDYVDRGRLDDFLDAVGDTPCFLDFETIAPAIPVYKGTSPYQQVPVQYSIHIVGEDGQLEHREMLAASGTDPRREIAEGICRAIPDDATVLVYVKTFECSRIKELARLFPDLSRKLLDINNRVIDLAVPFQNGMYYNRAMGGSFSIKSVLPALFPEDESSNYAHLDGVHDGREAMTALADMAKGKAVPNPHVREGLLRYCEMDTYAMYRIWDKLKETV